MVCRLVYITFDDKILNDTDDVIMVCMIKFSHRMASQGNYINYTLTYFKILLTNLLWFLADCVGIGMFIIALIFLPRKILSYKSL